MSPNAKRNGASYATPVKHFKFVPVVTPARNENVTEQIYGSDLVTGYFQCRLITATPIAVPDTYNNGSPFIKVGKALTIPGSSLRGVFRSIYETATDSCAIVAGRFHFKKRKDITGKEPRLQENEWRINSDLEKEPANDVTTPCTDRGHLCKACALFGMVGGTGSSVGSRVRFTDAAMNGEPRKTSRKLLKELYSPKVIEGRKFYTHNPGYGYEGTARDDKRGATMDVLDKGAEFAFRVYYDRVTREQRDELAWVLTLGNNATTDRHLIKLGHGKSIGMGSAKVLIESVAERQFNGSDYLLNEVARREDIQAQYVTKAASLNPISCKSLLVISEFNGALDIQDEAAAPVTIQRQEQKEGYEKIYVKEAPTGKGFIKGYVHRADAELFAKYKSRDIICKLDNLEAANKNIVGVQKEQVIYAIIEPDPVKKFNGLPVLNATKWYLE